MYPTNAAYQAAIQQRSREWKLKLKISLDSGAVYDLTEDDIVLDSCTFTESAFCSDSLQVGSTYANGLDFTLLNRDGRFNDDNFQSARVTCEFGLRVAESGEEAFYFVPMGAFNVTEAGK